MRRFLIVLPLLLSGGAALAQEAGATPDAQVAAPAAEIDTSYRPSPSISARVQRDFLSRIRWSAGAAARDALAAAFAERPPMDIWHELVAKDGLEPNNVLDALTSYWVLNWIAANGAYDTKIDNAAVRRQLQAAMSADPSFRSLSAQQKQELTEGYVLNFLLEHAALNAAVEQKDVAGLNRLAQAALARFQQSMGVNLLAVEPGPEGFMPRRQ